MKPIVFSAIAILSCALSFLFGEWFGSRGVTTYYVDHFRVSFHKDWPTYGLPLADSEELLSFLRANRSEDAVARVELSLDNAIYDAERRRPHLTGTDLQMLDRALDKAAKYRK